MKWILRILLGLVGLLVLAMVVLFALSKRPDAGKGDVTIDIARPPDVVWQWISEDTKLVRWVAWLTKVEHDPATPSGVGHRETWVMSDPNSSQPMRLLSTVTQEDAPRSAAARIEFAGGAGDVRFTLTDLGNGSTRLRQESAFRYTNPVYVLMEPLVTPEAHKKEVSDFARLKQLAEAEAARP